MSKLERLVGRSVTGENYARTNGSSRKRHDGADTPGGDALDDTAHFIEATLENKCGVGWAGTGWVDKENKKAIKGDG